MTAPSAGPLLPSDLPLAAAPMAGGPSNPQLAAAVGDAGGFPFLAGGYKAAEVLAGEIRTARAAGRDVGVNLFVPSSARVDEAEFHRYARELQPDAEVYGLDLSSAVPVEDDDGWHDKLDLLLADPVPVVSMTFGLPTAQEVAALRRAGSRVLVTVTTPDEARAAADLGIDGLVAQGSDAGAHSGVHDPTSEPGQVSAGQLTRAVVAATGLPVVATGGVDGPRAVRDLLEAGAAAVAVGTLLLRCDESGASQTHKDALGDPVYTETVVTRAFTGRPARALRNAFIDAHGPTAPAGYPAIHHLTRGLRQRAAAAGDASRLHLWAGTGYRRASTGPAATVVQRLVRDL